MSRHSWQPLSFIATDDPIIEGIVSKPVQIKYVTGVIDKCMNCGILRIQVFTDTRSWHVRSHYQYFRHGDKLASRNLPECNKVETTLPLF